MSLTTSDAYRSRAAARRLALEGGPLGSEPRWTPSSAGEALEQLETVRNTTFALTGRPVPPPSSPEERRRWPSGRIEDRRAP